MKKNKSLLGRLQNVGLYLRHPVDAGRVFADVHIEKKPAKVHQSRPNSLCPLCALWLKIHVYSVAVRSIKNNKSCETNPISEKPKMIVTAVHTMTNSKKQRTMNYSKQTQSNPNLPATPFGGQSQFQTEGNPKNALLVAVTASAKSAKPIPFNSAKKAAV